MEDPRVGSVLDGRYRIDARLAAGGTGAVYYGTQLGLQRSVAIKFLHQSSAKSSTHQGRFEREAQIMSRLGHPNIAAVIDFGSDEDSRYLVMELCKGISLRDEIAKGPLQPHRAVQIARQILAGLAHAHEANVVHRDLKPGNVLLMDNHGEDQVKILDFGVAKIMSDDGPTELSVAHSGLLGTPHYMSPEQARAEQADSRADLYALGIILYEMTTGKRPFNAGVGFALLRQHVEDKPMAPRELCDMSAELETVILRAMQKAREDRFQTVVEMMDALARIPELLPQPDATATNGGRARWGGMALLALGTLAVGGWYGAQQGWFDRFGAGNDVQQKALAPIDVADAAQVVVAAQTASIEESIPVWSASAATIELGPVPTLPSIESPSVRGKIDGRRFLPQFAILNVEGDTTWLRFTDRAATIEACFGNEHAEGETAIAIPLPLGPHEATRLRSDRRSEIAVLTEEADSLRRARWKLGFEEVDTTAGTVMGSIELSGRKIRLSGAFEAAYCPDPKDLALPSVNGVPWNSELAPEPDLLPKQAVGGAFGAIEFLPARVQLSRVDNRTTLSFFANAARESCSELGASDIGAVVSLPDDTLHASATLRVLLPGKTSPSDAAHWAAFHVGSECATRADECPEPTRVQASMLSLRVDAVLPGEVRGRIYLAAADARHSLLVGAFRAEDCRSPSVQAEPANAQGDAGSGDAGLLDEADATRDAGLTGRP